MKKLKDGAAGGDDGLPQEVVGDARFSRIHNDPRFQRLPKHKAKVPIDSRFAGMFHDKGFAEKGIDKRGGSKKSNREEQYLRRYYKYEEEDEAEKDTDSDGQIGKILRVGKHKEKSKDLGKKKKKIVLSESSEGELYEESDEDQTEMALEAENDTNSDEQIGKILLLGKQKGKSKDSRKKKKIVMSESSDGELDEESDEDETERELASVSKAVTLLGSEEGDSEVNADSDPEEGSGLDEYGEDEEKSSSSSSSSSESDSEDGEEIKSEEKIPTTDQESKRLALMNMDWDHIRAVDLLVVMRSFQPKGGNVESVTIYPSEFGIEQMAKEAVQGPQEIFTHDEDDSEDEADPEKLREYEKAKLRYYYAVAECDTVATASGVYSSCDGLEYEKTSNTLDLRFIPDDMKFVREPKDTATDIPNDYKPVEFETRALQHSNVKLTWDDDEPLRAKALRRRFNADQLNEHDYRDYVASSSSDGESESEGDEISDVEKASGEVKQKFREKYLSLLSDAGAEEGNVGGKKSEKGNIEIKFNTGLDELSEKLTEKMKKSKTEETVWESYLRKKKEKKKARKNKSTKEDDSDDFSDEDGGISSDGGPHTKDDPFFNHGEDPFDDPFFQDDSSVPTKGKGRKSEVLKGSTKIGSKFVSSVEERKKKKEEAAQEKVEEERRKAELELLLMDDDMVQNGETITRAPKDSQTGSTGKKKKKGKEKAQGVQEKLSAAANYEDPRFANLFSSYHFAIDPTDPQFKKSGTQLSTIAEKQRQRLHSGNVDRKDQENVLNGSGRKRKAELSSLVRSLKSKVQARK